MRKKGLILFTALLACLSTSVVSCGGNSNETGSASYVNAIKGSIYGTIEDFNVENSSSLSAGQELQFKVSAAEDFKISAVTYSYTTTENGKKVTKTENAHAVENKDGYYAFTLKTGKNTVSASFDLIDKDYVEAFKLNISDELFNNVMENPPSEQSKKVNGLDFRRDGIEQAMTSFTDPKDYFINYVDGDTTHVNSRNYGYSVKIRYLGIDTPESTSELEEWGKSASNYNKQQLSTAKHIILESQGTSFDGEKHESTVDGNQRSLAYVWYTDVATPTKADFKCLNLEMVYQGFSFGIGSIENMGDYFYKAFDKANKSAQLNKRHIYSSETDPNYYYGKPVSLDLKSLYATTHSGTDSALADNKTLYRIKGYVSRKLDTAFYIQDKASYSQTGTEIPEAYGIYIFTYAQTPIKVGDEVEVIGVISSYGGAYQMMGISYHTLNVDEDRDTKIISSGHTITPIKVTASTFNSDSFDKNKFNGVLVEFVDDLYCYNKTNSYGNMAEGGIEEINKYNEQYPFYNTSNKITGFARYGSTTGDDIRFVAAEEILFDYGGKLAKSYKFFTGGTLVYNPHGAEYANTNDDNVYKDDTITTTYKAKQMHVVGISSYYVSTSGGTKSYQVSLVSKADVTIKGEIN